MEDSYYKAAIETMREALLVVDTQGTILSVNPAFETMTGYSSRELVGKPCTVLNCTGCRIHEKGTGKAWCAMFSRGGVRDKKCEIESKDGTKVFVTKHATVLYDEKGDISGAVEILSDRSEMVRKEEEIESLRSTLLHKEAFTGIIGSSKCIQKLLDLIANVAQSEAPVLLYGESGVGKELVAQALHMASRRFEAPFIKVNCASLNENLLESELFGHVKGAFTGAGKDRIGRFEAASGGSIFLDEIGDISPAIQVKLLRVLESREIERVGDHQPVPVDVRVISATNKNLEDLIIQGLFREDLYYRINVVPVHVPPLREHKEDIPLLAQTFIDKIARRSGKPITGLSPQALEIMLAYNWPGNVRELRNTIEYAFVLCNESLIGPHHLTPKITQSEEGTQPPAPVDAFSALHRDEPMRKYPEAKDFEENPDLLRLLQALQATNGNQTKAAGILGISRVAVWKKMKKYGVTLQRGLPHERDSGI
ncbi:sigma-54-dependent Fis family transcriptional regulator [Desulforhabdus sp. TSK]|uniref:sigma-54 interaction domain-containing protein n=1 Tax=Desulforhabdus sp. TSK TaxID=2925014 RepID=UPI001FC8B5F2|nr:sigma 54-interacting transcriptional regulator [Desulforhabdus sp. TSK]GKT08764.1 sigma-54-dependent Fis family transcriptional regulator [Desulforhabdus sp. TSK]